MATLMRAKDWSATPLGPSESWPQSLRSAVSFLLPSKAQIALFWGPELITLYNDAYRPVFGGKHPQALGQPVRESWAELWEAGLRDLFENVLRTGEAFWARDRPFYMERYGFPEETFFDVSYDPVRDESGAIGGLFCIVNDTTARVVGERRLKVLRDLAAAGGDARGVGAACTVAMSVLSANALDVPFALAYLFDDRGARVAASAGVPDGELVGEWPLGARAEVTDLATRFRQVPAGPWPERPRTAMVLPLNGGALVLGASPRLPFDDSYRGFFDLVARQVDALIAGARAVEEERRRAEALAELDRAKTAFFSNVSHEFRTPLTLMLGPLEEVLARSSRALDATDRATLEVVQRNGQRLLKLVNTLLDFARIEAGRAEACYEPTDLAALTSELASNFRSACERAGLALDVDCPPLGEAAYVDREMWEKIVLNLLSNAFKFTLEGGIGVRLSSNAAHFELEVRDTGSGIAAEELPRVFERFRRVEASRGRSHEGSGIGLALVQELVKLHGGSISAESEPGKGSAFTVRVPKGSAHLVAERIRARHDPPTTSLRTAAFVEEALGWIADSRAHTDVGPARDARRILVADDNADLRYYVRRLLAEHYQVEAVNDGEEALAATRRNRPDLVVADVMMPKLDGFGLLAALRADPELRDLPVMLLSARAGEEARIEGLGRGADDYLVKPFSARELLVRVGALLRSAEIRTDVDRARRDFLDTAPAMLWATEPDGSSSFLSRGWYDYTGQTEAEALGFGWMDALHPDDRARVSDGLLDANAKRIPFNLDCRLRRRDGEYRWVIDAGRPRFGPHGEFLGFVGSVIDVHDRREAEEALREREERYRTVLESQTEMVCRFRPDGTILFANDAYARAVGKTPAALLRDDFWSHIPAEDRPGVRSMLETLTPDSPEARVENRFDTVGGERWTLWTNRALAFDGAGRLSEAQSTGIDITARKRVESALRESEGRLRLFIENAPAAIAMYDRDMRYLAVSRRFMEDYGLAGDVTGRSHYDLFPNLPHAFREAHRRGLAGETLGSDGDPFERADGTVQWVKWDVLPWRTATGEVGGILIAAEDITARREADRQKDEFIATLSHELRNPLAPLRNALHLLRHSGRADVPGEIIAMMERQLNHLVRLTDDLLEMSRITRGAFELRRARVEVASLIQNALETSDALLRERGHRLSVTLPEVSLSVDGDPVRLAQVLSNLLNNAAHYTPKGGTIQVRAFREDGWAAISVLDDGAGISREQLPRVFDMFSRGDGSTGLGIGLALARRLTEMHDGTIEATSEGPGRGAEFTVRLPLAESAASASAVESAPSLPLGRILVVDDNSDAADSLGMLLETLGADVRVEHGGAAALQAFEAYRPGLVLLDIGMPDMDGYEVARAIRSRPTGAHVPLVALTGWGQESDRKRAREAGFDHHLIKPADIGALRSLIASLAER